MAAVGMGDGVKVRAPSADRSDGLIDHYLRQFYIALALVPNRDSADYFEALAKCPELVRTETHPYKFLQREGFNAQAAAVRFINYWRLRKRAFRERAFKPLTILGPDGALYPEDIELLKTGYVVVVPRVNQHAHCIIDYSRLRGNETEDSRLRGQFFLPELATSLDVKMQTGGVVCIWVYSGLRSTSRKIPKAHRTSLLGIVAKFHVGVVRNKSYRTQILTDYVMPFWKFWFGNSGSFRVHPWFGISKKEVFAQLVSGGFKSEDIPPNLGGTFSYDAYQKWLFEEYASSQETDSNPKELYDGGGGDDSFELERLKSLSRSLESLPFSGKSTFLEACQRIPWLVYNESMPSRFLAANRDSDSAARKLVAYWATRSQVYGDRALLPLTMSERHALTSADLWYLDQGIALVLPEDSEGRPVICVDNARIQKLYEKPTREVVERLWFYCLQIASENDMVRTQGVVILLILTADERLNYVPPLEAYVNALPLKVHMVHIIAVDARHSRKHWNTIVRSVFETLGNTSDHRHAFHIVPTKEVGAQRLRAFGLARSGYPVSIGGQWNHLSHLEQWKKQRLAYEIEKLAQITPRHFDNIYGSADLAFECEDCVSSTGGGSSRQASSSDDDEFSTPSKVSIGQHVMMETTETIKNGIAQVEEAISMLPEHDKALVLSARSQLSELAELEAPRLRFLRFASYDPWQAAIRLAAYWKARRQVYGERVYLPMNQSGEGTLRRDDLTALGSRDAVLLPYDRDGRTVVCYDSRRFSGCGRKERFRLAFYLWSIMCENNQAQSQGCRIIVIMHNDVMDPLMRESIQFCLEVLPIRVESIFATYPPGHPSLRAKFNGSVVTQLQRELGTLASDFKCIVAPTKEELAANFAQFGIEKSGLPMSVGGSWELDHFFHWQEHRVRYEWSLPPLRSRDTRIPHVPGYIFKVKGQLSKAERIERSRRRNVLNSRRKRSRDKVREAAMEGDVDDLRARNQSLREENELLENILTSARAKMSRVTPGADRASLHSATSTWHDNDLFHDAEPFAAGTADGDKAACFAFRTASLSSRMALLASSCEFIRKGADANSGDNSGDTE